jgi:hypothetical protein
MTGKRPLKLPPFLLFLDVLGTALLALGILEGFTAQGLLPDSLKFDHYPYVLIGLGVALMAPLFLHIIRHVTRDPHSIEPGGRGKEI